MILLTATTDKLQLVTSGTAAVDVHVSFMDMTNADPPVVKGTTSGRTHTAIASATTTDILAAPAASTIRNVKTINIRNKNASENTVTVVFDQNGTDFELHKATLKAGEVLEYVDGVGWFLVANLAKLDANLVTHADQVNATTSFDDITGLTSPVLAGVTYLVEALIIHRTNATTTGARFGFNGPAMTYIIASTIDTVTASVTASAHSAGSVSALETAITAQTTGSVNNVSALINGSITPSANGTFAMRCASEVAVANGLTVVRGSWLKLRQADN